MTTKGLLEREIGFQSSAMNSCPLKTSLWTCAQSFHQNRKNKNALLKANVYNRIWIFTNDDNPFANDPAEQARVVQVRLPLGRSRATLLSLSFELSCSSAPHNPIFPL